MKNEKEVPLFVPADKFQIAFSAAALLRVMYALLVIFLGYQWYSVSTQNDNLSEKLHFATEDRDRADSMWRECRAGIK